MKKTAEDFKNKVIEKGITQWLIHDCSMCGYHCGFHTDGENVAYDNGCDCSWQGMRRSSFEDIAQHYNRQDHPKYIAEMDAFWGFENAEQTATQK